MDSQLKGKIIQDLENSGFGSEMKTIRTFLSRNWSCTGGVHFYDLDNQRSQEIDFIAHRSLNPKRISTSFYIVGEVKKTNPWVVFKNEPVVLVDAWNNLIFGDNIPLTPSGGQLVDEMTRNSLLAEHEWQGHGIHESFSDKEPPRWYSAFASSCKAAENILESESYKEGRVGNDISVWDPDKLVSFAFVKPVVIIDSKLYSAETDVDGQIDLTEVETAPVNFEYRSKHYKRESGYSVDVVTLKALESYIEKAERRHQDMVDGISALVREAQEERRRRSAA